jgi:formate/nitrite transporter FocA (FNT family)
MSGRAPDDIWQDAIDEGERRMDRSTSALVATAVVGGLDVMIGVLLLAIVSGAFAEVLPAGPSHVLGALVFGVGFAFLTIGRGELFTENFLLPVGAVVAGRNTTARLIAMWVITLAGNFAAILLVALMFTKGGVLEAATLHEAGALSDTLTARDGWAAFLSAVLAGATMTLFTWLAAAAENDLTRVVLSLLVGLALAAPSLNHAVVGFGEIVFGLLAGSAAGNAGDLARIVGLAIAGNLVGGLGLVTVNRLVQARGEPD